MSRPPIPQRANFETCNTKVMYNLGEKENTFIGIGDASRAFAPSLIHQMRTTTTKRLYKSTYVRGGHKILSQTRTLAVIVHPS